MPFFIIFEWLGPLVEVAGYIFVLFAISGISLVIVHADFLSAFGFAECCARLIAAIEELFIYPKTVTSSGFFWLCLLRTRLPAAQLLLAY
jgi:hypothetical protein